MQRCRAKHLPEIVTAETLGNVLQQFVWAPSDFEGLGAAQHATGVLDHSERRRGMRQLQ